MKIAVNAEGHKIRLYLPLSVGLVRFGLRIARRYSDRVPDPKLIVPLIKELKRWKKKNGKITLVEVEDQNDGTFVQIVL